MSVVAGQDAKAAAQRRRFEETIARIRTDGPRDGLERLVLESAGQPKRTSLTGPARANTAESFLGDWFPKEGAD